MQYEGTNNTRGMGSAALYCAIFGGASCHRNSQAIFCIYTRHTRLYYIPYLQHQEETKSIYGMLAKNGKLLRKLCSLLLSINHVLTLKTLMYVLFQTQISYYLAVRKMLFFISYNVVVS